MQRLINFYNQVRPQIQDPFPELTERKREVLDMIAKGMNNIEIASALALSQKTVRNHVSTIFNKFQIADRSQAIIRARRQDWGES